MGRWSPRGALRGTDWSKSPEGRREGETGMRTSMALMIAVLLIGSVVLSCAAG
jgi:hypothetical protein